MAELFTPGKGCFGNFHACVSLIPFAFIRLEQRPFSYEFYDQPLLRTAREVTALGYSLLYLWAVNLKWLLLLKSSELRVLVWKLVLMLFITRTRPSWYLLLSFFALSVSAFLLDTLFYIWTGLWLMFPFSTKYCRCIFSLRVFLWFFSNYLLMFCFFGFIEALLVAFWLLNLRFIYFLLWGDSR